MESHFSLAKPKMFKTAFISGPYLSSTANALAVLPDSVDFMHELNSVKYISFVLLPRDHLSKGLFWLGSAANASDLK